MYKIFSLIVLFPAISLAQECNQTTSTSQETLSSVKVETKVPEHLKGALITITKSDGTTYKVKAEDFMVVPRKHSRPVSSVSKVSKTLVCEKRESEVSKNILSLSVVSGDSGLEKSVLSASEVEVSTKKGV